jgi:hypothetical protein
MSKFWRVVLGWISILFLLFFSLQIIGLTFQISDLSIVIPIVIVIFIPFMIWYVKVDTDMQLEKLSKQVAVLQTKESE